MPNDSQLTARYDAPIDYPSQYGSSASFDEAFQMLLAIQPYTHQRKQLIGIDWLGDIVRSPCLDTFPSIILHRFGGQRNNRQLTNFLILRMARIVS